MVEVLMRGSRVFSVEREVLPRVLPAGWCQGAAIPTGRVYRRGDELLVVVSVNRWDDGRNWLHASASRADRLPSWDELREVKDLFVGRERVALQVLPRQSEYVNVHPHCLHLWCCLDGDAVPSFVVDGGV